MGRRSAVANDRARRLLAQEAARIIVEQGIQDFRLAKTKAAERLGLGERGSLPGNSEIQQAVSEHLNIFRRESHASLLEALRRAALSAMEILATFRPRLVGPVLCGTVAENSAVNLHAFSDTPELVAMMLEKQGLGCRPFERRLKSRPGQGQAFAGYSFFHHDTLIEVTVFPVDGMRQAPISPVDGRPMRRADRAAVRDLLRQAVPEAGAV